MSENITYKKEYSGHNLGDLPCYFSKAQIQTFSYMSAMYPNNFNCLLIGGSKDDRVYVAQAVAGEINAPYIYFDINDFVKNKTAGIYDSILGKKFHSFATSIKEPCVFILDSVDLLFDSEFFIKSEISRNAITLRTFFDYLWQEKKGLVFATSEKYRDGAMPYWVETHFHLFFDMPCYIKTS